MDMAIKSLRFDCSRLSSTRASGKADADAELFGRPGICDAVRAVLFNEVAFKVESALFFVFSYEDVVEHLKLASRSCAEGII